MSDGTGPDVEIKEDWLRQELRASSALLVSLMQWGVFILTALEVSFYYIRQDVAAHLRDLGRIHEDALLPLPYWLIGTIFLLLIAFFFTRYADRISANHALYRLQLISMTPTYSTIAESTAPTRPLHRYLYYAFPLFDLAIWVLYYAGEQIGGRFDMVY
jgi:hypothetical protein